MCLSVRVYILDRRRRPPNCRPVRATLNPPSRSVEQERRAAALQQEALRVYLLKLQGVATTFGRAFETSRATAAAATSAGAATPGWAPPADWTDAQARAVAELQTSLAISFGAPPSNEEVEAEARQAAQQQLCPRCMVDNTEAGAVAATDSRAASRVDQRSSYGGGGGGGGGSSGIPVVSRPSSSSSFDAGQHRDSQRREGGDRGAGDSALHSSASSSSSAARHSHGGGGAAAGDRSRSRDRQGRPHTDSRDCARGEGGNSGVRDTRAPTHSAPSDRALSDRGRGEGSSGIPSSSRDAYSRGSDRSYGSDYRSGGDARTGGDVDRLRDGANNSGAGRDGRYERHDNRLPQSDAHHRNSSESRSGDGRGRSGGGGNRDDDSRGGRDTRHDRDRR